MFFFSETQIVGWIGRQTERQTDRQTNRWLWPVPLVHFKFPNCPFFYILLCLDSLCEHKNNHFSRSCFFCLNWCLEIPSTFEQVVWFHSCVDVNNTALEVNISFPHSSIRRYLGWFHNLGIINASPIHKDKQISLLQAYTDAAGLHCCIWIYTHYYIEWRSVLCLGITESFFFLILVIALKNPKTDFSSGWTSSQSQWLYMKTVIYFYIVWRSMIYKLLAGNCFLTLAIVCYIYIYIDFYFWGCHTCIQQTSIIHPSLPSMTATALISHRSMYSQVHVFYCDSITHYVIAAYMCMCGELYSEALKIYQWPYP